MFKTFPDYKKFFNAFKDVEIKDLPDNETLKRHAGLFMETMTKLVDNLEKKEELLRLIMKLVESHHKRNLTIEQFTVIYTVMNAYLLRK